MIHVGTDLVAFEPEVIRVIRVGLSGSVRGEMVTARRAHREVCDTYQRADRRAKMRREQAEWRAEQKRKKKDKGL